MATQKLAIAALLSTSLCSCSLSDCENTALDRVASPDGLHYAHLFERGCGATTTNSIHLSVTTSDRTPKGKGNALTTSKVAIYSPDLRPYWLGNNSLHVPVPAGSEVYFNPGEIERIKVQVELK